MYWTLGNRIKMLRKERRWRLADLSKECGLSIPYLSDVERETVNPSFDTICAIVKAYNLTLSQFFRGVKCY